MNPLRLLALLRQLVEHVGSYAELGASAAAEYRSACKRRITYLLAAIVSGYVGIAALWAAGLVALWDTPWRLAYAATSALALLLAACVLAYAALSKRRVGPSSDLLHSELQKDMELFRQWKSTQ